VRCLPMIGTEFFACPALLKMQGFTGWSRPTVQARLRETGAGYEATLTGEQGSGVLNSLVQADGLAVIQEEVDHLQAGTEVEVFFAVVHLMSGMRGIATLTGQPKSPKARKGNS
jgi:hypothetical protein